MNEIGIRRALGADSGGVARLVMGKTLQLTAMGIGIGVGAAVLAGQILGSQLHTVGPREPWVFGGVIVVLAAVSVVASVAPLIRALAIDPALALRRE